MSPMSLFFGTGLHVDGDEHLLQRTGDTEPPESLSEVLPHQPLRLPLPNAPGQFHIDHLQLHQQVQTAQQKVQTGHSHSTLHRHLQSLQFHVLAHLSEEEVPLFAVELVQVEVDLQLQLSDPFLLENVDQVHYFLLAAVGHLGQVESHFLQVRSPDELSQLSAVQLESVQTHSPDLILTHVPDVFYLQWKHLLALPTLLSV